MILQKFNFLENRIHELFIILRMIATRRAPDIIDRIDNILSDIKNEKSAIINRIKKRSFASFRWFSFFKSLQFIDAERIIEKQRIIDEIRDDEINKIRENIKKELITQINDNSNNSLMDNNTILDDLSYNSYKISRKAITSQHSYLLRENKIDNHTMD